jgi:hypothetical protein
MMGRRMGRPGLVGMAARTAVVAGTATAVSGGVARRQNARAESKAQDQYDAQQQEQQQYAAPPAPVAEPAAADESTDDLIAQLKKLGELKEAGVLDEAEFQTAKAKLLAQM